ncbi:MAG: hypothetical protein ACOYIF_10105 [Acetivibrionales bacterium]|jgi:hypothetical protein
MKILIKTASILLFTLCLFLLAGYSDTSIAKNEENPIALSMPQEEGINMEKIGDGSAILVKLNTDYGFSEYLKVGASDLQSQLEYFEEAGIEFRISNLTANIGKLFLYILLSFRKLLISV